MLTGDFTTLLDGKLDKLLTAVDGMRRLVATFAGIGRLRRGDMDKTSRGSALVAMIIVVGFACILWGRAGSAGGEGAGTLL